MKNIYIIPLFFILLGCHNEDNPKVELQAGKYTLTDDPNDYVQHYIYDFYQKYGVVILTNPDSSDYVYNFNNQNPISLKVPEQEKEVLKTGLQFIGCGIYQHHLFSVWERCIPEVVDFP